MPDAPPTDRRTYVLGTGDGRTLEFADLLPVVPVQPGSVQVEATIKGAPVVAHDDGEEAWAIGGTPVGGWLHYATGYLCAEFAKPPDQGTPVQVTYRVEAL
jgi:hypothetical protein